MERRWSLFQSHAQCPLPVQVAVLQLYVQGCQLAQEKALPFAKADSATARSQPGAAALATQHNGGCVLRREIYGAIKMPLSMPAGHRLQTFLLALLCLVGCLHTPTPPSLISS